MKMRYHTRSFLTALGTLALATNTLIAGTLKKESRVYEMHVNGTYMHVMPYPCSLKGDILDHYMKKIGDTRVVIFREGEKSRDRYRIRLLNDAGKETLSVGVCPNSSVYLGTAKGVNHHLHLGDDRVTIITDDANAHYLMRTFSSKAIDKMLKNGKNKNKKGQK